MWLLKRCELYGVMRLLRYSEWFYGVAMQLINWPDFFSVLQ